MRLPAPAPALACRLICLPLLACLLAPPWAGPAQAAGAATVRPTLLRNIDRIIIDDPRVALSQAQTHFRHATDAPSRFWALMALMRAQYHLDPEAALQSSLEQARATLATWPGARAEHHLWLEYAALQGRWTSIEPRLAQAEVQKLRLKLKDSTDAVLACEVTGLELELLVDVDSLDEAWRAAEQLERCANTVGEPELAAAAVLTLGTIAGHGLGDQPASDPDAYFERAWQLLGDAPARLLRATLLWQRGVVLGLARRDDQAMQRFEQALALWQAIDDRGGAATAQMAMASLHLKRGDATHALQLLKQAQALLDGIDRGFRLHAVAERTISALAMLKRPEVISEIERARRWDTPALPPAARSRLARTMAEGYASQGRYADAYREVQRSERWATEGRGLAADVQILRLQARYAAAQREAENVELRHRSETARLALVAESATQRALWAAIATLALAMTAGAAWGLRALNRRRVLADLALRDELTGQPNRRAVTAYAQAQFEQARKLAVPLTLALIDLDYFKRVNDTLGHAAGDAVLRAFAQAGHGVLRGQDRLGRWGGEEWLLVMPGTALAEMPALFERLRERFAVTPAAGLDGPHGCTFSMGAAQIDAHTASLEALIAQADRALYRAKASGRNQLCADGGGREPVKI